MKALTYKQNRNGSRAFVETVVPANHSEAMGPDRVGVVVAGVLLFLATSFVSVLVMVLR